MSAVHDCNGKRFVGWPQFLVTMIGMCTIFGGSMTFVWSQHSAHPHNGSVTKEEMRHFERRFDDAVKHIGHCTDRLEKKVDSIATDVGEIAAKVK